MQLKIAPSVLSAEFERLGEQVLAVEAGGADQIHVDVMDGHFVPNLSMGPVVVEALRRATKLFLDVHLMIADPESFLDPFVKAGANHITFHVEVARDPVRLAAWLRERGVGAGIALNPETPVERVLELLPFFDLVLVMTVQPGFGGQAFLADNLLKVSAVRQHEKRRGASRGASATGLAHACRKGDLDVEVDGGIDQSTALRARRAGANVFVAGSAIFGAADPRAAVRELRRGLEAEPGLVCAAEGGVE